MLFTFSSLVILLEVIMAAGLRLDIDTLGQFLLKKEKFILLKAFMPIADDVNVGDSPEELSEFYEGFLHDDKRKHNVIANISKNNRMDIPVDKIDKYIGAGIYKEGDVWNLYIPLEI
jgi:hypothetical protein